MLVSSWRATEVLPVTLQSGAYWKDEEGFGLLLPLLWYAPSWYSAMLPVIGTRGKNT